MEEEKNISENTPEAACEPDSAGQAPQVPAEPEQPHSAGEQKKTVRQKLKEKRSERKQKRRETVLRRRQLRRELRRQKKEAYRCKTVFGKTLHILGGILKGMLLLALLFTVIRVNYKEIGAGLKFAELLSSNNWRDPATVTQEELEAAAPLDPERGEIIDSSAPIPEGETWAIYLYMVGSDLEARYTSQLSDVANHVVLREALPLQAERDKQESDNLNAMVDTILDNGMDLPNVMYTRTVDKSNDLMSVVSTEINKQLYKTLGDPNAASSDLEEIMKATLPENVKLVIQPGGATAWNSSMVNPNRTQRFVYDSQGMHKVYDGHIRNMGDPDTLVDFLTYCEEEHPADHTMVLFWNHGGASFGYGYDSIYLDDYLSLKELRWAFEQVYTPDEENPPLDIIGFDACLMSSMEVAHTFHGMAGYLVASEEVEPGSGWDYTDWLGRVAENPRLNALQMGKAAADSYMDHYGRKAAVNGQGIELFSLLDLRLADDLYEAYSRFAAAALEESVQYAGTAAYLGKTANASIKFAVDSMDVYNTLDLGLFMEGIAGELEPYSQDVLKVMEKMVVYNRACSDVSDATGITVYYPATVNNLKGLSFAVRYIETICSDPSIQALYYYKVAGCLPQELQDHVAQLGCGELMPMDVKPLQQMEKADFSLLEGGNFRMAFSPEARTITQEYRYNLLQAQEDGSMLHLGYDDYLSVSAAGDLVSEYDGKWASIDGELLPTRVVSSDGSAIRYSAPVMHNGHESSLIIRYDLNTRENKIIGVQVTANSYDNSTLADRNTHYLNPGDTLAPIYEQYDIQTGVGKACVGKEIIYREDTQVLDIPIPDGSYMSYVTLVDARGDVYDMKPVSFTAENGTIGNVQLVQIP